MIIFDLDGTLADCEHRRYLLKPENYPEKYEHSNYYINSSGRAIFDNNGKSSWRYKSTGKSFEKGWQAFYQACDKDIPIKPVISTFTQLCESSFCDISIWSGRCESARDITMKWLYEHVPRISWIKELKMRPIRDSTPDDVLKERWLDEAIAEGQIISYVFDDRPKVVRMWRRRGIFVFNCCQHDEEF